MSNRPVALNADGSVTLRKGRLYRLLVLCNGTPGEEELRSAVLGWGFSGADTGISWPGTWHEDAPHDWPAEAPPTVAANEFLVRVSGSFTGPNRTIGHDSPIPGDGTASVVQAWDYGAPTTEAIAAEGEPADEDKEKKTRTRFLWLAGGIFAAGMIFKFSKSHKAEREDGERLEQLEARAEHARRSARVRDLLGQGHDQDGAEAIAEHESYQHESHEHEHEHGEG